MGAMFVLQVRTGRELRACEMIDFKLKQTGNNIVKGIYANETSVQFIDDKSQCLDVDREIREDDIQSHLQMERIRSAMNNRRLQLESIEKYTSVEYEEIKKEIKEDINELNRELTELRKEHKKIKSVLSGYVLIELKQNSTYLPDDLWHLFNQIPLVLSVLDRNPIPEEEMHFFAERVTEIVEPEVIVAFEKEREVEELEEETSKLIYQANKKEISREEQEKIFDKIDDLHLSVVDKTKEIISGKTNGILGKIKAFIKRKREMVSMPLALFESLYSSEEINSIGKYISRKDFLIRLEGLTNHRVVIQ